MARRLCSFVMMIALATTALAGVPKPYASDKWGFVATFPYEVKEAPTDTGVNFSSSNASDTVSYMLGIVILGDATMKAKSSSQILEDAVRGSVQELKGAMVVSNTGIALDGYPGRECVVAADQFAVKYRMYLVLNRVYILMEIVGKGATPPLASGAFLDSFRFK